MSGTASVRPDGMLTTREAAERLGVAYQTLVQWRWAKTGPAYVHASSRQCLYAPADVDAWQERRMRRFLRVPPAPAPPEGSTGLLEAPRALPVALPVAVRKAADWYGGAVIAPEGEEDGDLALGLGDVLEALGVPEPLILQVEAAVGASGGQG